MIRAVRSVSIGLIQVAEILAIDKLDFVPQVEMFGNKFQCAKTKVFNPLGLNMAAV